MAIFLQALIDSALLAGLYSLMAIGLSFCLGVLRIINFAQGEIIMLGAFGSFWLFTLCGIDPLISLPLMTAAGFLTGIVIFRLFIDKVLNAPAVNQILLTFGLGLVLQHIAVIAFSGNGRSVTPAYAFTATNLGFATIPNGRLIAFLIAIIMMGLLAAWLRLSEKGRAIQAVSQNRTAATLVGIDVRGMYQLSFGISCALSAAAGAILSFILTITPFMGFPILVKGIAIVVLGGLGSLIGTMLGAVILALAETFMSYYVANGAGWSEGLAFVLIILILTARPRGILGQAGGF